jgi:hypothetical protein
LRSTIRAPLSLENFRTSFGIMVSHSSSRKGRGFEAIGPGPEIQLPLRPRIRRLGLRGRL